MSDNFELFNNIEEIYYLINFITVIVYIYRQGWIFNHVQLINIFHLGYVNLYVYVFIQLKTKYHN